jgi:hypothetical protein
MRYYDSPYLTSKSQGNIRYFTKPFKEGRHDFTVVRFRRQ